MKFPGLKQLKENIFSSPTSSFDRIEKYDDVKEIVRRALDSEDNYNMIFIGAPSSGKTLFLQGIMEMRKDAIYFDTLLNGKCTMITGLA